MNESRSGSVCVCERGQRRNRGRGERHRTLPVQQQQTSINENTADTFQSLWEYGMWAIFHRMFTNEHFAQALSLQLPVLNGKSHTFVLCL